MRLPVLWAAFGLMMAAPLSASAAEGVTSSFPAPGKESGRLKIIGAMDTTAILPLINGFQAENPGVSVEYSDYVTNDLYEEADAACRRGESIADVLVSSSVDHLVRLANDGCARPHRSALTDPVPDWMQWRNEVYGFTHEPAVLIYHSDFVDPEDVPRSHADLADLLRRKPTVFFRRIGTYDLRASGIGYLLAYLDSQLAPTIYGRLVESMSRVEAGLYCCNSEVLREVEAGRLFIGYNILGSYAYAAQRRNPKLRISVMRDYTHILSRGAMLPKYAGSGDLGGRFLDYLLSPQGKATAEKEGISFPWEDPQVSGITLPPSPLGSGVGRPIRIGPSLLVTQDKLGRDRFIADWTAIMVDSRSLQAGPVWSNYE
ncbi:ABC transporter substrate-binding protein [Novispirillum itersonii]|uniref:Iron(III) transport system substrate-binding protein n=1 Tax=Novispirillum itersonii TaxID=189 RepID=A0A7W9ZI39_NOVIT|nr:ABC transporter substrate-binding protein [Novispirillum itersonii]MBB6211896.1 iron(III) transport system substrate-binding protein [Novispirillum itersonii]